MAALFSVSALFLGIALIMTGNGLQGTLLGLRGSLEGFGNQTMGLVMSGYFIGFLAGSLYAPRVVARVGHIRVFAGLASLASAAVLVHSMVIDPWLWLAMRILTGFSYAGLYIVAESWVNDISDNENRGRLLSMYMVVQLGAISVGQTLLAVADPGGADLFMIVAVLVSLALLPICLTTTRAPEFAAPEPLGLRELFHLSPLGTVGMLLTGITNGAVFGFTAVFARAAGLSVADTATIIIAIFLGGMVMQWPVGRISDRFDRRTVIMATTFAAALVAALATLVPLPESRPEDFSIWLLIGAVALFGGLSIPLYSLFNAHVNDRVPLRKMVAASSRLVFLNGAGAIAGPNIAAAFMDVTGARGFFISLALLHGLIGILTLFRMARRAAPTAEQQVDFMAMPVRGTTVAVQMTTDDEGNPTSASSDDEAAADSDADSDRETPSTGPAEDAPDMAEAPHSNDPHSDEEKPHDRQG